jgi:Flp pilus assembly protein TadG
LKLRRRERSRGQSLAEFALVFPFFAVILFGVIEFAFVFNAVLSIDFATRDAALAAAEAGDKPGADCSVLRAVERSVGAPADPGSITTVRIFMATPTGAAKGPVNTFTRGGTFACADGTGTMPYTRTTNSYPEDSSRCNVLAGCPSTGSPTVDTIGVEMTYVYKWKTPLASLLPMSGPGYTIVKANAMRMEPVL